MVEAINFFQSLKNFGLISNPKIETSERKLSRELIKDARQSLERAEIETRSGDEAKSLLHSTGDQKLKKTLAKIAIWHYETAAKHFRHTAARYAEASRLRPDQEKLILNHAKKVLDLAQRTDAEIELLQNLD